MFRQIVTPQNTQLLLQIPQEFVGHSVEVIAFTLDINESSIERQNSIEQTMTKRLDHLREFIGQNQVILPDDYKFNREELYE